MISTAEALKSILAHLPADIPWIFDAKHQMCKGFACPVVIRAGRSKFHLGGWNHNPSCRLKTYTVGCGHLTISNIISLFHIISTFKQTNLHHPSLPFLQPSHSVTQHLTHILQNDEAIFHPRHCNNFTFSPLLSDEGQRKVIRHPTWNTNNPWRLAARCRLHSYLKKDR